jgi:hypothetical protein
MRTDVQTHYNLFLSNFQRFQLDKLKKVQAPCTDSLFCKNVQHVLYLPLRQMVSVQKTVTTYGHVVYLLPWGER